MKRRILAILSALSLAMLVATCIVWVRSYWAIDELKLNRAQFPPADNDGDRPVFVAKIHMDGVSANRGVIRLVLERSTDDLLLRTENLKDWSEGYPPGWQLHYRRSHPYEEEPDLPFDTVKPQILLNRFGFFYGTCGIRGLFYESVNFIYTDAEIPAWFLAAMTVLMPGMRLVAFARNRRWIVLGRCSACGYDLRATPDRCPECGKENQLRK
ncbi:MAG TPA: hypothetical protein VFC46_01110 [Humisphaera sp.]|nr:hypothetical protein [Humisphaera sp.]